MEVLWKMARSQSALSHSPGMILGKNMKRSGERIHVVKANLYSTVISQGQNVRRGKNLNSKKTKSFKQWRESMEILSLVDKKIDDWLKD